jgi:hypothetical protein
LQALKLTESQQHVVAARSMVSRNVFDLLIGGEMHTSLCRGVTGRTWNTTELTEIETIAII